ncbi:MAG: DALR domain-containing protein, partial [Haloplanus sp.]
MTWDSPWGEGRPGWHIECSAMSMTHLNETVDIHVGGHDLVFPHHENEVAQSEAATDERFARYWLHTGLLETEGEKMSSSLGNFFYVADALEEFGPNVVRTFYLGASYDSTQTFSEAAMREAAERWERLERAHERAVSACDSVDARTKVADGDLRAAVDAAREAFAAAMDDDFNVREATAALLDLGTAVNRHVDDHDEYDYRGLRRAVETFEEFGGEVLGLQFDAAEGRAELADDLVELVLEVREAEREAGNYDRADELREELASLGVTVEDGDGGPTYRIE